MLGASRGALYQSCRGRGELAGLWDIHEGSRLGAGIPHPVLVLHMCPVPGEDLSSQEGAAAPWRAGTHVPHADVLKPPVPKSGFSQGVFLGDVVWGGNQ